VKGNAGLIDEFKAQCETEKSAQSAACKVEKQELEKTIQKLEQEIKSLQERLQRTGGIEPSKPDTPRSEIPSKDEWNCPDIDGKEYTVLSVTYKVFCGVHLYSRSIYGNYLTHPDPLFLMTLCSVERNCQGVGMYDRKAQMRIDYEFPPTNKIPRSYDWSFVPTKPRTLDQGPMIPDIFSRTSAIDGGTGVGPFARCPDIDGEILAVGDRQFQVNCKKGYNPKKSTRNSDIRPLTQCLVACALYKKCQGVSYGCELIWEHEVLSKNTRLSELGGTESWVAMLVKP
jgi:hypothetical protein